MKAILVVIFVVIVPGVVGLHESSEVEAEAYTLLQHFEGNMTDLLQQVTNATWIYATDVTLENERARDEAGARVTAYKVQFNKKALKYLTEHTSYATKRRLKMALTGVLEGKDGVRLDALLSQMSQAYNKGHVCLPDTTDAKPVCHSLSGDLLEVFESERNLTILKRIWGEWRSEVARPMVPLFRESIGLLNKLARSVGLRDYSEKMLTSYEDTGTEESVIGLYKDIEPLYLQLHTYVRRKLHHRYSDQVIDVNETLPASLLGDLWSRYWTNLYPLVKPNASIPEVNITKAMLILDYNVTKMYKLAEEHFVGMGLKALPDTFWERSMLEDPKDGRRVLCKPSSWTFHDGKDFRIKMCTKVRFEHLQAVFHQLAHIQYYQQFAELPLLYRAGPNEGFQEAVATLMSLGFSNPHHLHKIGLYQCGREQEALDEETDIEYLMQVALTLLPGLPLYLSIDLWRWGVYRGLYLQREWNCEYWRLREQLSGVLPLVPREEEDLDPLATFHVANTQTTLKYFTSVILQFQILESLCKAAGHEGPLHKCDFYGSKEAGKRLASGLSLGASKAWPDVLHTLTGQRRLSSAALRRYFEPLEAWLRRHNDKAGKQGGSIGWGHNWAAYKEEKSDGKSGGNRREAWSCAVLVCLSVLLQ